MKRLNARLKSSVEVTVGIEGVDFNRNWIEASAIIENAKRRTIEAIRNEMHRKIAELSIDDLEFKITP
jgi:hypothetical protein